MLHSRKINKNIPPTLFHYGVGTVIIPWHVHVAVDSWNNCIVSTEKWFPSDKFSRSSRGTNYFVIFIISPHIFLHDTVASACDRKKQTDHLLFRNLDFGQPRGSLLRLQYYQEQNWHILPSEKWVLIRSSVSTDKNNH